MLKQNHRLTRTRSIHYILSKGNKLHTPFFVMAWVKVSSPGEVRVAIVASKKVGNAVMRHKIIRRVREVMRTLLKDGHMASGVHVVLVTKKEALKLSYKDLYGEIKKAIASIKEELKQL